MAKGLSNRVCVYCGDRPSTPTGDHIFARAFFPVEHRANLPKAPACEVCGGEKSRAEHYLATVLPFGGVHRTAAEMLQLLERRLAKNRKLHRVLAEGVTQSGPSTPMTLPFEGEAIEALFAKITAGLIWHHWNLYLPATHKVKASALTTVGEEFFAGQFSGNAQSRVEANLGDGTFVYRAAQGLGDPYFSLWQFRVFGGAEMADSVSGERLTSIGCLSATREFFERVPFP